MRFPKFASACVAATLILLAATSSADVVTGVAIKDYSTQLNLFDRAASHTIDDSGLSGGTHDNNPNGAMWQTNGDGVYGLPADPLPAYITFDLGQNYALTGVHIWNYNEPSNTDRGAGNVEILISSTTNVADLMHLDNAGFNFTFAQANGQPNYAGFDLDLSQVANDAILQTARLVRFNILSNHGGSNDYVGLSEVQFTAAVPECPLIAALPLVGLAWFAAWRRRPSRVETRNMHL